MGFPNVGSILASPPAAQQQPLNLNGYTGGYGSMTAPTQYTDMFGRPVLPSGGQENGGAAGGGGQPGGGGSGFQGDTANPNDPMNWLVPGYAGAYDRSMNAQARFGGMPAYNAGNLSNINTAGRVNAISPLIQQMGQAFGGSSASGSPYQGFNTNFGMSVQPGNPQLGNPQLF